MHADPLVGGPGDPASNAVPFQETNAAIAQAAQAFETASQASAALAKSMESVGAGLLAMANAVKLQCSAANNVAGPHKLNGKHVTFSDTAPTALQTLACPAPATAAAKASPSRNARRKKLKRQLRREGADQHQASTSKVSKGAGKAAGSAAAAGTSGQQSQPARTRAQQAAAAAAAVSSSGDSSSDSSESDSDSSDSSSDESENGAVQTGRGLAREDQAAEAPAKPGCDGPGSPRPLDIRDPERIAGMPEVDPKGVPSAVVIRGSAECEHVSLVR